MDPGGILPATANMNIRQATSQDCVEIHRLIGQLATFQGYPQSPELSVENLQRDGFPPADGKSAGAGFQAIVAEHTESHKVIGFALFYPFYSTWKGKGLYLEDIFVEPEYRHNGVGKKLFATVCRFALENGCNALRLAVLAKNTKAKLFYEKQGFENLAVNDGWELGRFGMDAMIKISNDSDNEMQQQSILDDVRK